VVGRRASSFPKANSQAKASSPAACRFPYRRPFTGARVVLRTLPPVPEDEVRCWSWRCPGCAFLKAKDAQRLAKLGIEHAQREQLPLVFLTLTEPTLAREFKDSSKALTLLIKRLQEWCSGTLRWIAVCEWQQRGAVHWHLVIAGMVYRQTGRSGEGRTFPGHPRGQDGHVFRKEADLRPLVERYGFGRVFNVHAVGVRADDTASEVASYLSKYLTKGEDMARLPKGVQPVRTSRGRSQWAPGYTLTSLRDERREAARVAAAGRLA
jgi:hypothetical protein